MSQAQHDFTKSLLKTPEGYHNWPALQVFSLFRFFLTVVFLTLVHFEIGPSFLAQTNPGLFIITIDVFLAGSVVGMICAYIKKPDYDLQVNIPIFFDLFALTLLMHASGGLVSGLGLLLVAIIAAHSLLAPVVLAYLSAAVASSFILAEQIFSHFTYIYYTPMYSHAGLIGFSIFVTAFICTRLKKRMAHMQELAHSRGVRLANSLKLNAQVVAFMQQGVIVLNADQHIQLINSAALRMLAIGHNEVQHFSDLPIRFAQAFDEWLLEHRDDVFQVSKDAPEIRISGSQLSEANMHSGYVIFIHDISKEAQKAQHMKLALLGSLAANIAHEIRNPLSSAKHAAQLLIESSHMTDNDLSLANIIQDNCDRMNTVIKNVLSISKKQNYNPQILELNQFIQDFVEQFSPAGISDLDINLELIDEKVFISMDPSQLRQMMINICENGLRYSNRHLNQAKIDIIMRQDDSKSLVNIHIIDYGKGIDGRDAKHMFEPFYTTEHHGSGLGLYISREICQMNGGDIYYQITEHQGADFCIQLPRMEETRIYDRA